MILIDAIYINNSGGKILLDYLIQEIELTDLEIYYLLDKRIENNHPVIKTTNTVEYLQGGLISKHQFYKAHSTKFEKIFCFGNFPPDFKVKAHVITYFHQLLFVEAPKELPLYSRLIIKLKRMIFSYSAINSDLWLVQSEQVKQRLCKRFKQIRLEQIRVCPFYPPLQSVIKPKRKTNTFVYVSTAPAHKNHERLLKAFSDFYDKYQIGELHLTVGQEFGNLHAKIVTLQKFGYPIFDHGFIDRQTLANLYHSSEFVIYPSLAESFGLGIIEAIESGCKIVASDLAWLHAVCVPSVTFDPYSIESIMKAIEKCVFEELKPAKQLIHNEINEIINLLK